MATIDITGTAHATTVYSYTTTPGVHNVTTWWAWSCTCGKGDTGVDRIFAQDLARTHENRVGACICGDATATIEVFHNWVTYTLTCNCGLEKTWETYHDNAHAKRSNHIGMERTAKHLARCTLDRHACRPLTGHQHREHTLAIISPTATTKTTIKTLTPHS